MDPLVQVKLSQLRLSDRLSEDKYSSSTATRVWTTKQWEESSLVSLSAEPGVALTSSTDFWRSSSLLFLHRFKSFNGL
jgi:hypothetical protein